MMNIIITYFNNDEYNNTYDNNDEYDHNIISS